MATFTVLALFCMLYITSCTGVSTIQWYRTAKGTKERMTPQAELKFAEDFSMNVTVTIDRHINYQAILGFGGAFTDSASYVFSKLSPALQSTVLNMYFSEGGLHYNMARLPIGSCDFSLGRYTYDNVSNDSALTHFSIDHDKERIIPFIKRSLEVLQNWTKDPLQIVASPWSPPGWMKKNNIPYCVSCVDCELKNEYKQTWSDYFVKFIDSYNEEGINIWGVTVQNEPGACPLDYEGMHFTAETERDYIKQYLGPTMKKFHPNVNILMYDHNKDNLVKWSKTVYSDEVASSYVWGTAVHWYSGDDFGNLHEAHFLYPSKPILATEATVARESHPEDPDWSKGEHYAHDIIGDMNNWVVGFIDWNLLLDRYGAPNHAGPQECEGIIKCGSDAMILVDLKKQEIYPQVFYYYVGHISKYVPRGSLRIEIQVTTDALECTAFFTPSSQVVVIVMNAGDNDITFKIKDLVAGSVQVTALSHSIQTFIYNYSTE